MGGKKSLFFSDKEEWADDFFLSRLLGGIRLVANLYEKKSLKIILPTYVEHVRLGVL